MLVVGLHSAIGLAPREGAAISNRRVVLFIMDGLRKSEVIGRTKNDFGKWITARQNFPYFYQHIRPKGSLFRNVEVSNSLGISLPAYAEIFTGSHQDVPSNSPLKGNWTATPSVVEILRESADLPKEAVVVLSSWSSACTALVSGLPKYKDYAPTMRCGPQRHDVRASPFARSRSDHDTMIDALQTIDQEKPLLLVVILGEADEEGHLQQKVQKKKEGLNYGIYHYHEAMRRSDYMMYRIWKKLNRDPFYKGKTTFLFTTDHGRDSDQDPAQWATHGYCTRRRGSKSLCSGCKQIFLFASKPAKDRALRFAPIYSAFTHLNLAPTILQLFGVPRPTWMGPSIFLGKKRAVRRK